MIHCCSAPALYSHTSFKPDNSITLSMAQKSWEGNVLHLACVCAVLVLSWLLFLAKPCYSNSSGGETEA